ncbi:hypothetical protein PVMG_06025 [Plasmodium vivax Mauritania I]|uniref:Uncharacterized protein n=1 Tax=Plasmodium vivax Mauritania I TaxID=1035515 RepID=A0A0J9W3Y4_PLAVI|nr:hypothetical protein PVMG_06025 [Plasmodium vivax Mauritania I]
MKIEIILFSIIIINYNKYIIKIITTLIKNTYDFFDNILKYVNVAEKLEGDASIELQYKDCNGFSSQYIKENIEKGEKICDKYLKLYNSLINDISNPQSDPNYEKKLKFLNYWLNSKLTESGINKITCVNEFASDIEDYIWQYLPKNYTKVFTYNIKDEDLNQMNVLYNLYKKYSKMHSELEKQSCTPKDLELDCSNECFHEYKLHRSRCIGVQNKFCDELDVFKRKYETLYEKVEAKGKHYFEFFKRLPENENSNIISISLLGSGLGIGSLFGLLYKVKELNMKLLILYRIYQINCYNSLLL